MFSNSLRMSATKAICKQHQGVWGSCFGRLLRSQLLFPLAQGITTQTAGSLGQVLGEKVPSRAIFFLKKAMTFFFQLSYFIYLWLHWVFIAVHRLSCPKGCGIFPDQGLNPCPLH